MIFNPSARYGPPQCPRCGTYGYDHECPFKPCKRTPYTTFWRKLCSTFGLPKPDKIECNCLTCRAKDYATAIAMEFQRRKEEGNG